MPTTLSAWATAGGEPIMSADITAASRTSSAAPRFPCSRYARPSQRSAASLVVAFASGSRTRDSYTAQASAQRPSRSAALALSMFCLTVEDSTAFNSIVGLLFIMTTQPLSQGLLAARCASGDRPSAKETRDRGLQQPRLKERSTSPYRDLSAG